MTRSPSALGGSGYLFALAAAALAAASAAAFAGPDLGGAAPREGTAPLALRASRARALAYRHEGRIQRVFGDTLARGASAEASAAGFVAREARTLGAEAADLAPVGPFAGRPHVQPILYDAKTGAYRFTGVSYTQQRGGIPVFGSRLTLLVRNEPGFPLVLAAPDLRDLGDFTVDPDLRPADGDAAGWAAARAIIPGLAQRTDPRTVIFAGTDAVAAAPVVAREFIADAGPGRWRLVTDARTGDVLHLEDLVVHADLGGHVHGRATEGQGADLCGPEVPTPLPYAYVWIPFVTSAYTDADGAFVLEGAGEGPVEVRSYLLGEWFWVNDVSGPVEYLTAIVDPPDTVDFLHNEQNDGQLVRAQVNAYLHANVARDYALRFNPAYPTITNEYFKINVNLDRNCNAFYDGRSINFYTSGGGCSNTAFSTIVHHEYGHHLVAKGGSGQGAYGEGMSDVMGVLIFDDPGLAYGYRTSCNEPMRSADNNCRYRAAGCSTCGDEVHACGRLLSGCVWSTRDELAATHPESYREILSNLAINSILLHRGTSITPAITIDFLVLDDDNRVFLDGTPHYDEIAAGFGAHDMDAPAIDPCLADLDGSGAVDFGDVLDVLAAWGECEACPEDFDRGGVVDFADVLYVLAAWGPCPE